MCSFCLSFFICIPLLILSAFSSMLFFCNNLCILKIYSMSRFIVLLYSFLKSSFCVLFVFFSFKFYCGHCRSGPHISLGIAGMRWNTLCSFYTYIFAHMPCTTLKAAPIYNGRDRDWLVAQPTLLSYFFSDYL